MRILILTATLLGLTGCPTDGRDGVPGAQGPAGAAGISCWDLNENYLKDLPDEDTNSDGVVNVLDCRYSTQIPPSNVVVDTGNATISHQHIRSAASISNADISKRIVLTDISASDYETLLSQGNFLAMDGFLREPVSDPCGLWEWKPVEDAGNNYALTANSAIAYAAEHYAAVIVPNDPNEMPVAGFQMCESSCLSDESCAGAFFVRESNTSNAIRCVKVQRSSSAQASEYRALVTNTRGFVAANMQTDLLSTGVISVCDLE